MQHSPHPHGGRRRGQGQGRGAEEEGDLGGKHCDDHLDDQRDGNEPGGEAGDGRLLVELPAGESPGSVIDEVERTGARLETIEVSQEGDRRRLALDVALPHGTDMPALVARIADVEHVAEVRWAED